MILNKIFSGLFVQKLLINQVTLQFNGVKFQKGYLNKSNGTNFIMKNGNPVDAIVKIMTCSRTPEDVFDFFQDVKNWESGGIITSVTKVDNDLWTCSTPAGKAKIKSIPEKESLILDHIFIVGDITWNVYVRILANNKGSTTVWTFLKPDNLTPRQFQEQLIGFDREIDGWKRRLENST
jgi:hypothetical protein